MNKNLSGPELSEQKAGLGKNLSGPKLSADKLNVFKVHCNTFILDTRVCLVKWVQY